jgi:hypothetical protein
MSKYSQGKYQIKNPDKYVGKGTPTFRSSWEHVFMSFCDNNPNILKWASEPIRINYKNPFTGKNTIYVPDFLIYYIDRSGNHSADVIEVKPKKETNLGEAKSRRDQAYTVLNMAKWEAAKAWCKQKGLNFKIVTEEQIFHQGNKR